MFKFIISIIVFVSLPFLSHAVDLSHTLFDPISDANFNPEDTAFLKSPEIKQGSRDLLPTELPAEDQQVTMDANNISTQENITPSEDLIPAELSFEISELAKSFLNRCVLPFFKTLLGLLLILFGSVLLWFNEKKAVEMSRIVNFGEMACEEVKPDDYNPELNGELVHMVGKVSTSRELHDQSFGVRVKDSVKLKRVVQVYQVREVKGDKGGLARVVRSKKDLKDGFKYEHLWCDYSIPSLTFMNDEMRKVNDKVRFIAHRMTFTAETIELGSYKLTPYQIERLDNWVPLQLNGAGGITFSRDIKERIDNLGWEKPVIEVNENCVMIKQSAGEEPQVGDIKVSFYQLPCDTVTIIAEQAGISFRPYNIKEKRFVKKGETEKTRLLDEEDQKLDQALEKGIDRCCWGVFCFWPEISVRNPMRVRETIDWIYPGRISKKDFFSSQIKVENRYTTAIIRLVTTALLIVGLYLNFGHQLEKLVLIKLLEKSMDCATLIGNIVMGTLGSFLIGGFAWMFYRRWFGLGIILGAASLIGIVYVCQELKLE